MEPFEHLCIESNAKKKVCAFLTSCPFLALIRCKFIERSITSVYSALCPTYKQRTILYLQRQATRPDITWLQEAVSALFRHLCSLVCVSMFLYNNQRPTHMTSRQLSLTQVLWLLVRFPLRWSISISSIKQRSIFSWQPELHTLNAAILC